LGGQIKGDINLGKTLDDLEKLAQSDPELRPFIDFVARAKRAGALAVVSTTNVGNEIQQIDDFDRAIIALQPYNEKGIVRTNPIALAAHPEFFDLEEIQKFTKTGLKDTFEALARGEVTSELRAHLEGLATLSLDDVSDMSRGSGDVGKRIEDSIREAKAIISTLDSGVPIQSNPRLMAMLASSAENYWLRPSGKPSLQVPNAFRAHITTEVAGAFSPDFGARRSASAGSMFQNGRLRSGYLTYDDYTHSFVLPALNDPNELRKTMRLLGGADLDDALASLLRYDKESREMIVLGFRDPTSRGENVLYRMGIDDPFLTKMVLKNHRSDPEIADIFASRQQKISTIADLNKDIRRLEKEMGGAKGPRAGELALEKRTLIERRMYAQSIIDDIDGDLLDRMPTLAERLFKGYSATEVPQYVGEGADQLMLRRYTSGDKVISPHTITRETILREAGAGRKGIVNARSFVDQIVRGKAQNANKLGQSINAMTFFDTMMTHYGDSLFGKGGMVGSDVAAIYREDLIDLLQQEGAEVGDVIERHISNTGEIIGRTIARLRQEGSDISLPYYTASSESDSLKKIPTWLRQAINRGIGEVDPSLHIENFVGTPDEDMTSIGKGMRVESDLRKFAHKLRDDTKSMTNAGHFNDYTSAWEGFDDAAEGLLERYDELRAASQIEAGDEVLDDAMQRARLNDKFVSEILSESREGAQRTGRTGVEALQEMLLLIRSKADRNKVLGQMLGVDSYGGGPSLNVLLTRATAQRAVSDYDDFKALGHALPDGVTEEGIARARDYLRGSGVSERDIMSSDGTIRRALRETADAVAGAASGARAPTRTTLAEGARRLWDIDHFRKGTYGVAAVAAASVLYRRLDDRREEDITGPDFTPGGAPYEMDYSRLRLPELGDPVFGGSGGGTSFQINAAGNYDAEEFLIQAQRIAGAQAFGTIYNSQSSFADLDKAIGNNY
jgi:hypothetical protein